MGSPESMNLFYQLPWFFTIREGSFGKNINSFEFLFSMSQLETAQELESSKSNHPFFKKKKKILIIQRLTKTSENLSKFDPELSLEIGNSGWSFDKKTI